MQMILQHNYLIFNGKQPILTYSPKRWPFQENTLKSTKFFIVF